MYSCTFWRLILVDSSGSLKWSGTACTYSVPLFIAVAQIFIMSTFGVTYIYIHTQHMEADLFWKCGNCKMYRYDNSFLLFSLYLVLYTAQPIWQHLIWSTRSIAMVHSGPKVENSGDLLPILASWHCQTSCLFLPLFVWNMQLKAIEHIHPPFAHQSCKFMNPKCDFCAY